MPRAGAALHRRTETDGRSAAIHHGRQVKLLHSIWFWCRTGLPDFSRRNIPRWENIFKIISVYTK
jgi:hypothetical protein